MVNAHVISPALRNAVSDARNARKGQTNTNQKKMKNKISMRNTILAVAMAILPFTTSAAVWTTTAQYGEYDFGNGYAVNNDIWGSGAGPQTLYVDTLS
ncbi:MAG: hypothetical protein ACREC8_13640 [Limisphaerales bacterium]